VRDVCTHKLENGNSWDLNNTRGPSIYAVFTAVWTVMVNSFNCNILRFFKMEGNWHLKYMLDIRSFVFINPVKMGPWC